MYNILLDGLPTKYKDYRIRTSYRIGVDLNLLFEDDSVDSDYKVVMAIDILYIDKPDDINEATAGIGWFLSCGTNEAYYIDKPASNPSGNKALDFQYDANEIYGTLRLYGIKLEPSLHWFEFMSIVQSLPDCPLSQRMGYRVLDLSKFKGQTRAQYADIQNKVRVRKALTKEEYEEQMKEAKETYGSYYEQLKRLNSGY